MVTKTTSTKNFVSNSKLSKDPLGKNVCDVFSGHFKLRGVGEKRLSHVVAVGCPIDHDHLVWRLRETKIVKIKIGFEVKIKGVKGQCQPALHMYQRLETTFLRDRAVRN